MGNNSTYAVSVEGFDLGAALASWNIERDMTCADVAGHKDAGNTLILGPQSRFGDKLLIIRGLCPHIWECGSKRVKTCRVLLDMSLVIPSNS